MVKCKCCKKDFEPKIPHQVFCCETCAKHYSAQRTKIRYMIRSVAKKFNFDIQNEDRIIKAKMLLFQNNFRSCPCDANNPNRYCGSAQCIHDVIEFNHCHCNLFHKKPTV